MTINAWVEQKRVGIDPKAPISAKNPADPAKAMVVTGSRLHAVRYLAAVQRYLEEKQLTGIQGAGQTFCRLRPAVCLFSVHDPVSLPFLHPTGTAAAHLHIVNRRLHIRFYYNTRRDYSCQ